jgi:hypothetical protein
VPVAQYRGSGPKRTIAEDDAIVFAHACRLGVEGIVSKKVDGAYQSRPCRVWIKVRTAPASLCSGSAVNGIDEPQPARAGDDPPQGRSHPRLAAPAQLF